MSTRVQTIDGKKLCTKCKQLKPLDDFGWRKSRNNYRSDCNACRAEYRAHNGRDEYLWRTYGVTEAQYRVMLDAQDGVCAICGGDPQDEPHGVLSVDHCHSTRKVRGLLCQHCNIGLGRFRDDADLLEYAAAYIRECQ